MSADVCTYCLPASHAKVRFAELVQEKWAPLAKPSPAELHHHGGLLQKEEHAAPQRALARVRTEATHRPTAPNRREAALCHAEHFTAQQAHRAIRGTSAAAPVASLLAPAAVGSPAAVFDEEVVVHVR